MLFAEHAFALASILVDPFVVALLAGGVVELLPGAQALADPAAARRREVDRAARATFVERGVHHTTRPQRRARLHLVARAARSRWSPTAGSRAALPEGARAGSRLR